MNNQDAITALGAYTGMTTLSLDREDECSIEVDGRLQVSFTGAPQETTMEATAALIPVSAFDDSLDVLLDLNFAGAVPDGGWFAIDRNSGNIVLRARRDFAHLATAEAEAFFEGFAKAALHWIDELPSLRKVAGDTLKDLQEETLIRI